ncbi:LOW QUALITY PROTEIN: putative acyl-CoA dehydrogenase 6 [Guaruba guarouba]
MALQGSGRRARLTSALSRGSSGRRGAGCGSDRPQHHDLRAALRKIINKEINHFVDNWGEEGQFPAQEVFKTLGQAGFLGAEKTKEYGGMGFDFSYSIAVAEELGRICCGGIPMAIGVQAGMATPALTRFGSDELKKRPAIIGDFVVCMGISEAGAGSDVTNIKTTAVRKGDEYIINGSKMWTMSRCQADWMYLLANTTAHQNKSLLCLPMNLPVIHVAKKIDKLGMKLLDAAQIFFEDVRAPSKNLIGEEGTGFTYQMLQFQEERLWGVATVLTLLATIIIYKYNNEAIDYTRQQKAFDWPMLHNQAVHFCLAELATKVELLHLVLCCTVGELPHLPSQMCFSSCKEYIQSISDWYKLCQLAKETYFSVSKSNTFINEAKGDVNKWVCEVLHLFHLCLNLLYFYRDLTSVGGGTDEIMLSIIWKYFQTSDTSPLP